MTDEDSEHLARRRWEHVTDAYQRGLGGFECRILALPVAGRRPALRPTIKGPSLWVEPGVFLAAVADDEVYCREAGTYRAGHLAATDRDDQAEHRPAR